MAPHRGERVRQIDIRIFFDILGCQRRKATQNHINEHTQEYLATHVTVAHGKAINHIDLCAFASIKLEPFVSFLLFLRIRYIIY